MARTLSAVLAVMAWVGIARAQSGLPLDLQDVKFDQRLNAQAPLDVTFRDETGKTVTLHDYFDGKPVILNLAYFRCPMLCDQVLNGMTQAMLDMPYVAGKDFHVLTVSFDPAETPEMAAAKKKTYLGRYGHPEAADGWHFLTGDEGSIKRLTDAVGFRYHWDARHEQYAHAAGLVLLTPLGKVSRYFFDVRFSPTDLRLGLVEASQNHIGSLADQVLLFCFHYDPEDGKYGPAILNLLRLGGVLTVLGIGVFVGLLWRRERRRRRLKSEAL